MRTSRWVVFFIGSFLVGVAMAQLFLWMAIFFGGFCLMGIAIWYIFFRESVFGKTVLSLAAGFIFGVVRFLFVLAVFNSGDIAYYRDAGVFLKVEGFIGAEVDVRSDRQYLVFYSEKIFHHGQKFSVAGKILIKAPRYPEYRYGDFLQIECLLRAPSNFEKFSYADFLAKDDIYVVCYKPHIYSLPGNNLVHLDAEPSHLASLLFAHVLPVCSLIAPCQTSVSTFIYTKLLPGREYFVQKGRGHFFWNTVFWLKSQLSERVNELFSEPEASLVSGLLFGLRRNIPSGVLEDFNLAGLTHVLAISGYNITLMITIFGSFFKSCSRKIRFIGVLGGIFLFLLFTGFSASVMRAAWMGFFVLLGNFAGRKTNGLLILFLSVFVMVFLNPRMLLSDLSFELSFAATLGLVVFMPRWEKYYEKLPSWLGEGLAITLAAQVFTTPIIVYYFGRISLISPIANILFLPLIPWIMLFSFAALMISYVFLPFASFLSWVAWLLLRILVVGVHMIARLPLASVDL